ADFVQGIFVGLGVFEAFGAAVVVVKGYAGADDVYEGETRMGQGTLQQGDERFDVTGEGTGDIAAAHFNGHGAAVDGVHFVFDAALGYAAFVGGGGKLPFGEAIDAVVFKDVNHGEVSADGVEEMAEADGSGVAVSG